jgi:hypothetical protein
MACRNLYETMPFRDRSAWILVFASALAAMVAGHAIELWLESTHLFGEGPASYHHVAQSGAAETAIVLFALVAVAVINRLAGCIAKRRERVDCMLPALHAIADAGIARIAPTLAALQLTALFGFEIAEQRLSGFQGNALGAIVGPGHASALLVHLMLALLVTFALCRFARFASERTGEFIEAVVTFLRRALVGNSTAPRITRRIGALTGFISGGRSLLAYGLANRPPPCSSAALA